jgi:hypothetical protein
VKNPAVLTGYEVLRFAQDGHFRTFYGGIIFDAAVKSHSGCHCGEPFGTAQDKLRDVAIQVFM